MRSRSSRSIAVLGTVALMLCASGCSPDQLVTSEPVSPAVQLSLGTASAATELFVSEVVEGSSNNKAIEIYNGTGSAVNLGAGSYNVQMFFNGSASAGLTINLTGTVAAGDVFVVAHSSANATVLAQADQTNSSGWYNGDDAVVLRRGTTIVDAIGQVGFDPGTEWGSGLTSTADNTLRRKATICQGDAVSSDAFDPSVEWDGYATDTFGGLGSHSATCGSAPPSVNATTPANGATSVALNAGLSITFSVPVTVTGDWFTISCSLSGTHTAAVSGGPTAYNLDPAADFSAAETCTVTVIAAQVADASTSQPMAANYSWSFTTAAVNACDLPYTPAFSIQGSGAGSPLAGQTVTTEGIIVGDYEGASPALRGFYLQDAAGDGNPATSDAVFVFNGNSNSVALGDVVRVTGTVAEFNGQTQLGTVSAILACGSGTITPADVTLPFPTLDYLERYEGMLVRLPQTLSVTDNAGLGRFGEVVLSSGGVLSQPTNVVAPGAAALALQAQNELNRILLDDAINTQNADPIVFGRGGSPLSAANTLRAGDEVSAVIGVLTYTWAGNSASGNAYRVRPFNALGATVPAFQVANPRPGGAPAVGGTLRVASFNLLNYFNSFSACTNGVGGTSTSCRGAGNSAEFQRQRDKTIAALLALQADIVGVIELENDGYGATSAIQDLVDGLNAVAGAGTWAFIDADAATGTLNALGTDAIKVGLLYRPASVSPVGRTAVLNSVAFVNGGDSGPRNRPTVAQAFQQPNRARVVVSVHHLRSKGGGCDAADAGDGQGNCNQVRTNAMTVFQQWLATDPTDTGEQDVLVLGDLNAYAKEDPIASLEAGGFVNLVPLHAGPGAYSYGFEGQWGSLDHALASAGLQVQVTGAGNYHINADEPSVLDYNTEFKSAGQVTSLYSPDPFRSSDHDPVVVGLALAAPAVTYQFSGFQPPVLDPPSLNVVNAGSAVPIRFSLGGYRGQSIFLAGFPASRPVPCTGPAPLVPFTELSTPGNSGLAYDDSSDMYSYRWKTDRAWAGSCREIVLRFADESQQRAVFQFR